MRENSEEEAADEDIVDIDHVQETVEEWSCKPVNIQCMFDSIQSFQNMVDWLLPLGFVKIYAIPCFVLFKDNWGYDACSIIL